MSRVILKSPLPLDLGALFFDEGFEVDRQRDDRWAFETDVAEAEFRGSGFDYAPLTLAGETVQVISAGTIEEIRYEREDDDFEVDFRGLSLDAAELFAALQSPGTEDDAALIERLLAEADRVRLGDGDDDLDCGDGDDRVRGRDGDDVIEGGAGADRLRGDKGDDAISGGGHDDRLRGDSGSDDLSGGAGDDRLRGGRGDDDLAGGGGEDRFEFEGDACGDDRITDFEAGEDLVRIKGASIDGFEDLGFGESHGHLTLSWGRTTVVFEGLGEGDLSADDVLVL
mgnify:CR=1 FL=1